MKRYLIIAITLLVAMGLQIMPLPDSVQIFRPNWVLLVLIYWSMALPNTVRLLIAFVSGLIVDILLGTLIGQHALAFVVVVYMNLFFNLRIRVLSLPRQASYVFLLLLISQFLIIWVEGLMGSNPPLSAYYLPAITGMLIWPWAFIILRDIRRGSGIR